MIARRILGAAAAMLTLDEPGGLVLHLHCAEQCDDALLRAVRDRAVDITRSRRWDR